jgi:hypothetical protein
VGPGQGRQDLRPGLRPAPAGAPLLPGSSKQIVCTVALRDDPVTKRLIVRQ